MLTDRLDGGVTDAFRGRGFVVLLVVRTCQYYSLSGISDRRLRTVAKPSGQITRQILFISSAFIHETIK